MSSTGDLINEEDDLDFEEFCELSDDERQAKIDRECAAYNAAWDRLTIAQQRRVLRTRYVTACVRARSTLRLLDNVITRNSLRFWQRRLLGLRIWRATGARPVET